MVISHNLLAMNAQRQFNITGNQKKKTTEKLSSGYRINRSADDAAGLAISEKMRRQIRGLDQGARNIQDGISLLQVADGALSEDHEILQRMNQLAIQAANGTNTAEDRSAIQQEMDQLIMELDRTADTTSFNEKIFPLNHGGGSAILPDIPTGSSTVAATGEINPDFAALRQVRIDLDHLSTGNFDGYSVTGSGDSRTLTITGTDNYVFTGGRTYPSTAGVNIIIDSNASITMGDIDQDGTAGYRKPAMGPANSYQENARAIVINEGKNVTLWDIPAAAIRDRYSISGGSGDNSYGIELKAGSSLTIRNTNPGAYGENSSNIYGIYMNSGSTLTLKEGTGLVDDLGLVRAEGATNLTLNIDQAVLYSSGDKDGAPLIDVDKINLKSEYSYLDLRMYHSSTADIIPGNTQITHPGRGYLFYDESGEGSSGDKWRTISLMPDDGSATDPEAVTTGPDEIWIQAGAEAGQGFTIHTVDARAAALGINNISVLTDRGAGTAIESIKGAINKVSEYRSYFGAMQNRLEHAVNINKNISENTQAAESQIRDTDMAKEMVELSNHNILEQMGTSMITQANQSRQGVLSLLQ